MQRWPQKLLVIVIALPLVVYAILEAKNFAFYFSNQRESVRYVLPDNYSGWVVIESHPQCSSVQEEAARLYIVPADGWLCTPQPIVRQGFAQDQVVYQSGPEQNLLQHPGTKLNRVWYDQTWAAGESRFLAFYVGFEIFKNDRPRLKQDLSQKLQSRGLQNGSLLK